MGSPKADGQGVRTLLREAWKQAELAEGALERARQKRISRDLSEAFMLQATQHVQESRAAVERVARLLQT